MSQENVEILRGSPSKQARLPLALLAVQREEDAVLAARRADAVVAQQALPAEPEPFEHFGRRRVLRVRERLNPPDAELVEGVCEHSAAMPRPRASGPRRKPTSPSSGSVSDGRRRSTEPSAAPDAASVITSARTSSAL